jgi:hypothetical protein
LARAPDFATGGARSRDRDAIGGEASVTKTSVNLRYIHELLRSGAPSSAHDASSKIRPSAIVASSRIIAVYPFCGQLSQVRFQTAEPVPAHPMRDLIL